MERNVSETLPAQHFRRRLEVSVHVSMLAHARAAWPIFLLCSIPAAWKIRGAKDEIWVHLSKFKYFVGYVVMKHRLIYQHVLLRSFLTLRDMHEKGEANLCNRINNFFSPWRISQQMMVENWVVLPICLFAWSWYFKLWRSDGQIIKYYYDSKTWKILGNFKFVVFFFMSSENNVLFCHRANQNTNRNQIHFEMLFIWSEIKFLKFCCMCLPQLKIIYRKQSSSRILWYFLFTTIMRKPICECNL